MLGLLMSLSLIYPLAMLVRGVVEVWPPPSAVSALQRSFHIGLDTFSALFCWCRKKRQEPGKRCELLKLNIQEFI